MDNLASLYNCRNWLHEATSKNENPAKLFLVGNKKDLLVSACVL